jgi:hypothetical protein
MYPVMIPYFDDGDPTRVDDLRVKQNGGVLSIGPADSGLLPAYLAKQELMAVDDLVRADASEPWPIFGRDGRGDGSVAILVNGTALGELYEFNSAYPLPVVAAVTTGDLWPMVLARSVAQLVAALADEYQLPGAPFEQLPLGAILVDTPEGVRVRASECIHRVKQGIARRRVKPQGCRPRASLAKRPAPRRSAAVPRLGLPRSTEPTSYSWNGLIGTVHRKCLSLALVLYGSLNPSGPEAHVGL